MERYLRRNRLAEIFDGIGVCALILLLSLMWFVWLWGLGIPSLLAGMALGMMGITARSQWRVRTVEKREKTLRSRIGAELLLEEMLLSEARQAHFQAAVLLAERWPVTMQSVRDEGVICKQGEETLLVQCLRTPPDSEVSHGDLLAAHRAVKKCGTDRAVLCNLGKTPAKAALLVEEMTTPIRLIRRETLLALAAAYAPASDAQLVELGKRKSKPEKRGSLLKLVLRREKARRYYMYGASMLVLFILTGAGLYAVPGMLCMALAVFSRLNDREPEQL